MVWVVCLVVLLLAPPADAFWRKKPALSNDPPPVEGLKTQCDPIRQQIVKRNQAPVLLYPFVRPKTALLEKRYRNCVKQHHGQTFRYLKNVQVPGVIDPASLQDDTP
jgi:hypothetical protein